jgi:outer membrane protein OmpA-like peptidoglycan-associated protein
MIVWAGLRLGGALCVPLLLAAACAEAPPPPSIPLAEPCYLPVFFANGSADLSESEAKRLKSYVSDKPDSGCALNPDPRRQGLFRVTGYTDGIGSDEANRRLGLKRAQTVANQLIESGFARERLCVSSGGRRRLMVQTESAEPQNRLVTIDRQGGKTCDASD